MKIRVKDRVAAALSALLLLAGAAIVVADGFLDQHFLDLFIRLFASESVVAIVCKAAAAVILLVLAALCAGIVLRRRGSRQTVSQKTDNGELAITVKAIEGLVRKCVDTHDEMEVSALSLESERGGLVINLRVNTGSSVSIPLVVSALQKQLKQYITACTGLEVKEVFVRVDTAAADVAQSPYDLPDMLGEQNAPRKAAEEAPAEEPKKLPHQRVFEGMEKAEEAAVAATEPATAEAEAGEAPEATEEEAAEEPAAETEEAAEDEAGEAPAEETKDAPAETEADEDEPVFDEWGDPAAPPAPVEHGDVPMLPLDVVSKEIPEELEAFVETEAEKAEEAALDAGV